MSKLIKEIETALGVSIISDNSIGGGCIADAKVLKDDNGQSYFLKTYGGNSVILQNEANGLKELAKAKAVRIPEVISLGEDFLLLEYISEGSRKSSFFEEFGRQFADLHRFSAEEFGFYEDNYIGATRQKNIPRSKDWVIFYGELRLEYQFRLAEKNGYADSAFRSRFSSLMDKLESIIGDTAEEPSLLHGDLWGGNYLADTNGDPVIIDPAVYYGNREADLAMTKLFGGFNNIFYAAYNESYPLPDGYEYRENIYKLYHVMNHLNIFGRSYYSQTISLIDFYL